MALQETLATKRDRYDPGLVLGQTLIEPCTSRRKRELGSLKLENEDRDEEETPLLSEDRPISTKPKKLKKPVAGTKWSQILTPQSILVLISYTLVSGLGMAFDSVFPVFLHWPVQDLKNNPDVKLPFKFTSGFGIGTFKLPSRSPKTCSQTENIINGRCPSNWSFLYDQRHRRNVHSIPLLPTDRAALRRIEMFQSIRSV
jgi:hypothetical protein